MRPVSGRKVERLETFLTNPSNSITAIFDIYSTVQKVYAPYILYTFYLALLFGHGGNFCISS